MRAKEHLDFKMKDPTMLERNTKLMLENIVDQKKRKKIRMQGLY